MNGIKINTQIENQYTNRTNEKGEQTKQEQAKQIKNGSINANTLNLPQDKVMQKRMEARKKAMKIVLDQYERDKKIDDSLVERQEHIKELKGRLKEEQDGLKNIEQEKENLRKTYGVAEDSQEQADTLLLIKDARNRRRGYTQEEEIPLTEEEQERLKNMPPLTEYQERVLGTEKDRERHFMNMNDIKAEMQVDVAVIKSTKQALLKSHAMVDADKAADKILDNASKEIIGILREEAKDHIDEEQEKVEEAAEEKKEEKEEQEEKIEKADERKEEAEINSKITKSLSQMEDTQKKVEEEIKKMLQEQKLIEEDLKGIVADYDI